MIREWHLARGWSDIGYHWVILNVFAKGTSAYIPRDDGRVEQGRPEAKIGAHARGQNSTSIGIVLIGVDWFTPLQFEALERIVRGLQATYNIDDRMVFGHRDFDKHKTCPNFDVSVWIKWLKVS